MSVVFAYQTNEKEKVKHFLLLKTKFAMIVTV